jgi:hypothetical protein
MEKQTRTQSARDEVVSLLQTKTIFLSKTKRIVFLCGGPLTPEAQSLRKRFCHWARTNMSGFTLVLAEDAIRTHITLGSRKRLDLNVFEKFIADISDCTLIFPESAGSYAELGFFSAKAADHKVLVVNDMAYQTVDSFIALGPLSSIDVASNLAPTIWITQQNAETDFVHVKQRITSRFSTLPLRRREIKKERWKNLQFDMKIAIILASVTLLLATNMSELKACLKLAFYRREQGEELQWLLSFLVAAKLLREVDGYYLLAEENNRPMNIVFENVSVQTVHMRNRYYYKRHDNDRFKVIAANQ